MIAQSPGRLFDSAGPWSRLSGSSGEDTYQLVLFQVALGAFHIDVLVSRKLRTYPIECRGTSFEVLAAPGFKSSFQIFADRTIHNNPPAFQQTHGWRWMWLLYRFRLRISSSALSQSCSSRPGSRPRF
jgi:hypothetical protein